MTAASTPGGDRDAVERGESFVESGTTAAEERRLCRADLVDNFLRRGLEASPLCDELLSEQALEDSLQAVLRSAHRAPDVWVFAYGSLIWNPVLEFDERIVVTAHGYHRSFCLWSRVNRGTPQNPGLVLGLDRGGRCSGIAYRIPQRLADDELHLLWRREMLLGSYAPRWVHVTHGERAFRALAFVVNRDRSGYAGRLPARRDRGPADPGARQDRHRARLPASDDRGAGRGRDPRSAPRQSGCARARAARGG